MVEGGLRRAAADHTNLARAYVGKATETTDAAQQKIWLERALSEYKLADVGWSGFLRQDENAPDAYETRFWIADARHGVVVVTVNLDRSPSPPEINNARQAAVDVRDSNEDDKFLQPAAYTGRRRRAVAAGSISAQRPPGGAQGSRSAPRFVSSRNRRSDHVVPDPSRPMCGGHGVTGRVRAARPAVRRYPKNAIVYTFQWRTVFLYGHFDQAKARSSHLEGTLQQDEYGYKAWASSSPSPRARST